MISSQQDNRVTHVVSDKVVGTTANNQGASANNSPVVGVANDAVVGVANDGKSNTTKEMEKDNTNLIKHKTPSSNNSEPINSSKPTTNQ